MANETRVRAELRGAIYQAIATLGEKEAKRIVDECFKTLDDDHWGRRS